MKTYLRNVENLLNQRFGIKIDSESLKNIDETIIKGNQSELFQIEKNLCDSQKQFCVDQVHVALDTYHHPGMETAEIKTIVQNVLSMKARTPEITETVRLLLAE
jgi:uncharacterized protein YeeX (DUF496 family)